MNTPIDHYIEDALDDTKDGHPVEGYFSSRDVDEDSDSNLTKDVAFRRRSFDSVTEEMAPATDGRVSVGADAIDVSLVQGIDEGNFKRVCGTVIARNAGIPIEDVTWEEMLRGGLQTALETQVVVFAVHGVSRACTHQLVRTRKAAYHQQSQRAEYYGPRPETRMPDSVWRSPRARAAALRAIYFAHKAYETACEEDISYQDARYMLPEGTANFILCEYPLRTWLDTYAYRGCSMFQWEIVTVFRKMRQLLVDAHPWLEPYAKISCEKTKGALDHDDNYPTKAREKRGDFDHACTYQGYERVDDQCDFPWARESNRTFQPDEKHQTRQKESA